jgi:rRNA maturation protein Rpf1
MINDRLFLQLKIQLNHDQLCSLNEVAQQNGFSDLSFIRERYYNNATLSVYSCQKHNKYSFAIIHQLIAHINRF